jgi:F-type H+/Na+-transporting ATPase subunit beta
LVETKAVSEEHAMIRKRVQQAIAALWAADRHGGADNPMLGRALKLQNYFTQRFFIAEPYTKRPGATVTATEALRTSREILDGHYDDLAVDAFFFSGGIGEISGNIGRVLPFGPVTI